MTWSAEWESVWTRPAGHHVGRYPDFEKLIERFVHEAPLLLELGCGLGSNIPLAIERGYGYHGIDGSQRAVEYLRREFPQFAEDIQSGDFTIGLYGRGYDAIIDRASVAHNDAESIERCIGLVFDALRPGGIFVSSDWFSTNHSEFDRGESVDMNTRAGYPDGQFAGVGKVHFSHEAELTHLFRDFERIIITERIMRYPGAGFTKQSPRWPWISPAFDGVEYRSAVWDLVVRKPA